MDLPNELSLVNCLTHSWTASWSCSMKVANGIAKHTELVKPNWLELILAQAIVSCWQSLMKTNRLTLCLYLYVITQCMIWCAAESIQVRLLSQTSAFFQALQRAPLLSGAPALTIQLSLANRQIRGAYFTRRGRVEQLTLQVAPEIDDCMVAIYQLHFLELPNQFLLQSQLPSSKSQLTSYSCVTYHVFENFLTSMLLNNFLAWHTWHGGRWTYQMSCLLWIA